MIPPLPILKQIFLGATLLSAVTSLSATAQEYPNAVQSLIARGVSIEASFDAPGGMTGYVGLLQGRAVSFYLTPDKEHVVVGTMIDADGQNISEARIQELVTGPQAVKAWATLEEADWIRDGESDAPVILYTFTDPNCPYCHRFRESAKPWLDAGEVQLRHILVGILREDSLPKAATILGSENPAAALAENRNNREQGGIAVDEDMVNAHSERVEANNQLMSSLGLNATPSIYYRDSDDQIQVKQGAPMPEEMPEIMGSAKP